ncbi:hypothetical protein [Sulfurimonas sp.]|uniref:hypothetical protein n=1 Tax=Sulfurimonas sp. TaxID=2022749 RepID=UPI002B499135|nr:hypothetical protein [Sulfurimonas sp.]
MKKFYFSFLVLITLLSGCSALGPMQTQQGLLSTKQFKPIFIETVKDGSSEILFKEFTTMYQNDDLKAWGIFTITDQGVYFAQWDVRGFEYNIMFKLSKNEISKIEERIVKRDLWANSKLLTIFDKNGIETGFALNGDRAALSTLNKFIKN